MNDATPSPSGPQSPVIARLSTRLINQIAAGEVVSRPAAAIKELVENSLDAKARRIELIIEPDALSFSVRDDGCGMAEEDLRLSIERYATSKIRELEDLSHLRTRGFRGEALAAISAVSRMEILSRQRGQALGHRLRINGGKDLRMAETGAPEGTMITIRDLFFNTPARLKFLKSPVAEWGRILQTLVRQALTRPDVGFAIRWKGKPYLDLPPDQPLRDRLAQVLPSGASEELIEIDHTLHDVRVHGVVTGPNATRRDRRHQYYFVNERPIIFRPLQFALEEAYRGLIMTQRYPMGAIMIETDGEMVDVNVHPTKEEVRFRNEALISGAVHRAAVEALRDADIVPRLQIPVPGANLKLSTGRPAQTAGPNAASESGAPTPPGFFQSAAQGQPAAVTHSTDQQLDFVPGFSLVNPDRPGQAEGLPTAAPFGNPTAFGPPPGEQTHAYAEPSAQDEAGLIARIRHANVKPKAIAQIVGTYILAEAGSAGMLVIDQHAAHEKIVYLEFMQQAEKGNGAIEIQPLMIPHSLEVAPAETAAVEELIPALKTAGFDIDPFGDRTYLIQSIPVVFDRLNVPAFLRDLIDDHGQGNLPREIHRLHERICARAACRAAVKSGDTLTLTEMQRLVDDLMATADSLRCPHGRPTVLLMTRDMLDHQFGRL